MAKSSQKFVFLGQAKISAYKAFCLLMIAGLMGVGCFDVYRLITHQGYGTALIPTVIFLYQFYGLYIGIKPVEFDDEFLYVFEKGYEVVVPLKNIKRIDIINLGGIYKVTLFDPIQSGYNILFKPSLIYPLDFRKQDQKVATLRSYIRRARGAQDVLPGNALHS
ncbi:MAG TPA: hypothetical protein PLX35_10875 [Cyclobacteriaceae bacterium]|nr:hypothetical protein [Cyclobacteriaceae bacterium]